MSRIFSGPVQNDLAGQAGTHDVEPFLEFVDGEVVGYHRRYVQSTLDQGGHFVPGFEHFPAIDALDEQPLEDNVVPVYLRVTG